MYLIISRLHHEIIHFYHFMCPRPEEHQMRKEVVQRIQGIVRSLWPEAKVCYFDTFIVIMNVINLHYIICATFRIHPMQCQKINLLGKKI